MCGDYAYTRIDPEMYCRGAVTSEDSPILSHTVEYWRHSRLLLLASTSGAGLALYPTSYMVCGDYAYTRADPEMYYQGAVTSEDSPILSHTV